MRAFCSQHAFCQHLVAGGQCRNYLHHWLSVLQSISTIYLQGWLFHFRALSCLFVDELLWCLNLLNCHTVGCHCCIQLGDLAQECSSAQVSGLWERSQGSYCCLRKLVHRQCNCWNVLFCFCTNNSSADQCSNEMNYYICILVIKGCTETPENNGVTLHIVKVCPNLYTLFNI